MIEKKNANQTHGISKFNKMILKKPFMRALFCVCVYFEFAVNELELFR